MDELHDRFRLLAERQPLNFGQDTELKSVMDFRLMGIASKAFHEETGYSGGLHTIFEHMCYDYVYPDIYNVLRFLENHDTDRFLPSMPKSVDDLYAFKQGVTFLLTIPGIPQLYYGQELLMNGTKEKGRRIYPSGCSRWLARRQGESIRGIRSQRGTK